MTEHPPEDERSDAARAFLDAERMASHLSADDIRERLILLHNEVGGLSPKLNGMHVDRAKLFPTLISSVERLLREGKLNAEQARELIEQIRSADKKGTIPAVKASPLTSLHLTIIKPSSVGDVLLTAELVTSSLSEVRTKGPMALQALADLNIKNLKDLFVQTSHHSWPILGDGTDYIIPVPQTGLIKLKIADTLAFVNKDTTLKKHVDILEDEPSAVVLKKIADLPASGAVPASAKELGCTRSAALSLEVVERSKATKEAGEKKAKLTVFWTPKSGTMKEKCGIVVTNVGAEPRNVVNTKLGAGEKKEIDVPFGKYQFFIVSKGRVVEWAITNGVLTLRHNDSLPESLLTPYEFDITDERAELKLILDVSSEPAKGTHTVTVKALLDGKPAGAQIAYAPVAFDKDGKPGLESKWEPLMIAPGKPASFAAKPGKQYAIDWNDKGPDGKMLPLQIAGWEIEGTRTDLTRALLLPPVSGDVTVLLHLKPKGGAEPVNVTLTFDFASVDLDDAALPEDFFGFEFQREEPDKTWTKMGESRAPKEYLKESIKVTPFALDLNFPPEVLSLRHRIVLREKIFFAKRWKLDGKETESDAKERETAPFWVHEQELLMNPVGGTIQAAKIEVAISYAHDTAGRPHVSVLIYGTDKSIRESVFPVLYKSTTAASVEARTERVGDNQGLFARFDDVDPKSPAYIMLPSGMRIVKAFAEVVKGTVTKVERLTSVLDDHPEILLVSETGYDEMTLLLKVEHGAAPPPPIEEQKQLAAGEKLHELPANGSGNGGALEKQEEPNPDLNNLVVETEAMVHDDKTPEAGAEWIDKNRKKHLVRVNELLKNLRADPEIANELNAMNKAMDQRQYDIINTFLGGHEFHTEELLKRYPDLTREEVDKTIRTYVWTFATKRVAQLKEKNRKLNPFGKIGTPSLVKGDVYVTETPEEVLERRFGQELVERLLRLRAYALAALQRDEAKQYVEEELKSWGAMQQEIARSFLTGKLHELSDLTPEKATNVLLVGLQPVVRYAAFANWVGSKTARLAAEVREEYKDLLGHGEKMPRIRQEIQTYDKDAQFIIEKVVDNVPDELINKVNPKRIEPLLRAFKGVLK